jgi:Tfp pilus assembly protein PilF
MTALSRFWLPGILALAFALRLAYLIELRHTPFFDQLILDLAAYDSWAQDIARGDWSGSEVFYQDPLYPYFLAILYWVLGHRLTFVYLIQIVLGVITCYLVYWIGRRVFSPVAGLLAAGIAATYKPWIFYDVQIEKSFLAVFLICASCALLLRGAWLLAGLALGLAVLVRGNYLLLLPFVLSGILFLSDNDTYSVRIRRAMSYGLGVASILTVTLVRNFTVAGDWVLTTSQVGQNFFIGNNPENLTGMYRPPEFVRSDPKFERLDFAREAERLAGRRLKPSEVSTFWFNRAVEFIAARPVDFLKLLAQKTALFWNYYEIPDNLDSYFFERYSRVMRLWLPGFGVVAPLGALGMVLCLPQWRRLWPLYFFAAGYFLSIIFFYIFARYRLPVVPFMMVFAGQAIYQLYSWIRRRNVRQLLYSAALLLLFTMGVHLPLVNAYNPAAVNNLGAVLLRMGKIEEAESLFRQVIARRPDFADGRNNLGVTLLRKGDIAQGLDQIREAIRLKPRHPNSYVNLGQALLLQQDTGGAMDAFVTAIRLDPASAEAAAGLGLVHRANGDQAAALEAFRKALDLDPQSGEIHNNLAIVLLARGEPAEALKHFDAAIQSRPGFSEAHYNRGICLERLGKKEEAAAAYRAALAARSDYAEAYNNLGNLLAESGDRRGAVEAYENFLRYWRGDEGVRQAVRQEINKLK